MTLNPRTLRRALLLGCAAALLASNASAQSGAPEYDIVIRGGRVLDGAGNPWVSADVGIKDGRVTRVGTIAARGKREIDAKGRYVAPGFIDMMDQSGEVLLENGTAENKLRQGVTTVIAGEGGTPVEAAKIPAYFKQLETQGIGVNFGTYYATHQARLQIMGDKAGAPTPAQMAAMEKEVGIAMRAGVFGITSALIYPPSSFQTTEDLIKLAKVASQCNGFYATHMREESSKLIPAIEEAIAIGEKGGVKVEIFHLKNAYAPQWGKGMPKAVALVDSARARGVDIAADMYPYPAGGTGVEITVPNWVWADGVEKGIERLKDPAVRAKLKLQVAAGSMADWSNLVEASGGWDKVVLANGQNPKYEKFHGKNFVEIGKALGIDPPTVQGLRDSVKKNLEREVRMRVLARSSRLMRVAIAAPLIALYVSVLDYSTFSWTRDRLWISPMMWDQKENYAFNGFTLAFAMNVPMAKVAAPAGYSAETIKTAGGGRLGHRIRDLRGGDWILKGVAWIDRRIAADRAGQHDLPFGRWARITWNHAFSPAFKDGKHVG